MEWYIKVLKNYVNFEGRARRKEYWMFILINVIISAVLGFISGTIGFPLGQIYSLGVLLPTIAVGVRRMHDTDRPGWWLIVPIANLIFAVTEGTSGKNSHGDDPKAS